jgi:hypothetical protein
MRQPSVIDAPAGDRGAVAGEAFEPLLDRPLLAPAQTVDARRDGVTIGTVVGFADDGATPLVTYPGQPTAAALRARATVDLHAAHIGCDAVLMFDAGEPSKPIVLGCLRDATGVAPEVRAHLEADGERLVLSAKDQIVLRCGKASITLTREGKVIVQGAYVSNRSTGVLRIKGGAVHIN